MHVAVESVCQGGGDGCMWLLSQCVREGGDGCMWLLSQCVRKGGDGCM